MFSNRGADGSWSLTHRMALIFALSTSALLAVYATWSAHFVYRSKVGNIEAFLVHESQELGKAVSDSDGTLAEVIKLTGNIAQVSGESAYSFAFVVRDPDAALVTQAGNKRLLALSVGATDIGSGWRHVLLGSRMASITLQEPVHGYELDVHLDARPTAASIQSYLWKVLFMFLGSVVAAGFCGWFTARKGLQGLIEVVDQASHVSLAGGGLDLQLEGAPREVRDVGRALEDMIRRIESGLDRIRTFTAGLAHELRSPLQNLIGETEVALLRVRTPEEYEHLLKSNLEEMMDLSDAVDNMIAFCRKVTPDQILKVRQRFDLAIESRMRLAREEKIAERAGVVVDLTVVGDTTLTADREACMQVVRNLVGNAIQWSPEGGRVSVRLEGDREAVGVEVVDEGPGVPKELGPRVFDAFVSGQPKVGRRSGYGLGLAICRQVTEDHGGGLTYENLPRGGARFLARFPREPKDVTNGTQVAATTTFFG
jgi:signal transduction histidine kinase